MVRFAKPCTAMKLRWVKNFQLYVEKSRGSPVSVSDI